MNDGRVVVVGAGPSGIAMALALNDVGVRPLVVDRADRIASAWHARYDRLRLNTARWFSHLPDRRFEKGTSLFPSRDELIRHLEHHARKAGIDFRLRTNVARIDAENGGWVARTDGGDMRGAQMVVATGYENTPRIPEWEGRDAFRGRLLHAADYRNPDPFAAQRVLVVGPGCSGMEIAYDLATGGAAKVWLAVRTPPNIVLRQGAGGVPGDLIGVTFLHAPVRFADAFTNFGRRMDVGDLSEYGLPVPEEGVFSRLRRLGVAPSIVDREVIDAIKDGRIEVVREVESLEGIAVRLAGGDRLEPEAVICATGYERGLEPLVGHLGVLDERGVPRVQGAQAAAPGLRFIGYTARPGGLGYMSKQAKRAAKAIARELRRPTTPAQAAPRDSTKPESSVAA
jgi:Pyridine nucleotide-disulphide oxidoreductase